MIKLEVQGMEIKINPNASNKSTSKTSSIDYWVIFWIVIFVAIELIGIALIIYGFTSEDAPGAIVFGFILLLPVIVMVAVILRNPELHFIPRRIKRLEKHSDIQGLARELVPERISQLRKMAAKAITNIGGKDAIDSLVKSATNSEVVRDILEFITSFEKSAVADSVIKFIQVHSDGEILAPLLKSLHSAVLVEKLIKESTGPDPAMRATMVRTLKYTIYSDVSRIDKALNIALKDKDYKVRSIAAETINSIEKNYETEITLAMEKINQLSIEELIEQLRSVVSVLPMTDRKYRSIIMRRLIWLEDPRVLAQMIECLSVTDRELRLLAIEGVLFQRDMHSSEIAKERLIEYIPDTYTHDSSAFQDLAAYKHDEMVRRMVDLVNRYSLNHQQFSNFLVSLFTDALSYQREESIQQLAEEILRRVYGINAWDYVHLRE